MPLYDDNDGLPVDEDNDEMEKKTEDNDFKKLDPRELVEGGEQTNETDTDTED